MEKKKPKWLRLDNAGKIYPAAKYKKWHSFFRMSASLNEDVDVAILQQALDITIKRFPSIAVRLRRGLFWYYLEEIKESPIVKEDVNCPLKLEAFENVRKCAIRVLYYKKRIAVEYFHAITDGNGAIIFLKTLLSQYLTLKHGVTIPCECGVLDVTEFPHEEEFEDSFVKHASSVRYVAPSRNSYHIKGTLHDDYFLDITTGIVDVNELKALSKQYKCGLTTFLSAIIIESIIEIQKSTVYNPKRYKPVSLLIPVNLRSLFESKSLRNFALNVIPYIDPRLGDYTLEEIIKLVDAQIKLELDPKKFAGIMHNNVAFEKCVPLKVAPLPLKNLVMKLVYNFIGENTSCFTLSNLGNIELPEAMKPYITRFDCILSTQEYLNNNCGIISYNGKMYINFTRNIVESELERLVFTKLRKLGLHILIESNQRG